MGILNKLFDPNKSELKRLTKTAAKVEALASMAEGLSDEQLTAKTDEFRERYANGESLDDMLPEAFAVVREASRRVLGMYPFNVQLMGGIALHEGEYF